MRTTRNAFDVYEGFGATQHIIHSWEEGETMFNWNYLAAALVCEATYIGGIEEGTPYSSTCYRQQHILVCGECNQSRWKYKHDPGQIIVTSRRPNKRQSGLSTEFNSGRRVNN